MLFGKRDFPLRANYEDFGMTTAIVSDNGEEARSTDFWEWSAKAGGKYVFTLSEDQEN